jgi:hypothetical protein
MAIRVSVQNRFQIIVPVRFDRAVRGAPILDAPDIDDRGWVRNNAGGLNVTDTRGALFGSTVGDIIRMKVVREDLDGGVPLFLTVTGDQVTIDQPAGGGPLPADGTFSVRAVADTTTGSKVQVRFGDASGPVIGELCAHTFTPKNLFIAPHVCTIHSANAATVAAGGGTGLPPSVNGATLDDATLTSIFDTIVRPVWRPAGVEFTIGPVRQEVFTGDDGFTRDNVALQGTNQIRTVYARNRRANACNIFFLHTTDRFLGLGLNFEARAVLGANNSGILVGVNGSLLGNGNFFARLSGSGANLVQEIGNDIAHEIGHFLALDHADNTNGFPGRLDSYNRRFLMHPINLLPTATSPPSATPPRINDIGYGQVNTVNPAGTAEVRGHRGCLLTLKDHPSNTSDGEAMIVRRRFRSPNLLR